MPDEAHYSKGIRMESALWKLLRRYTDVVNHKLRGRGLPARNDANVIGAIVAHFLLENQRRILDEYDELLNQGHISRLRGRRVCVTSDANANIFDISDVGAASRRRSDPSTTADESAQLEPSLRRDPWGPTSPAGPQSGPPRTVQRRNPRVTLTPEEQLERALGADGT